MAGEQAAADADGKEDVEPDVAPDEDRGAEGWLLGSEEKGGAGKPNFGIFVLGSIEADLCNRMFIFIFFP